MRFLASGDASGLLPSGEVGSQAAGSVGIGLKRMLRAAPFASLSAAVGGTALAAGVVREHNTGTVFPGEMEYCAGHKGCPVITGAGSRTKRLAGIKNLDVYALALYVEPAAARGALQPKFGGAAPAALAKDQALFSELMEADGVEKVLRVVITSKMVKQRAFMDALVDRLGPPLKQAGELDALAAFKAQFEGAPFRKGFEIMFTTKGGKLVTLLDGQQVGTINSRPLARSLLDIYLGPDPVSVPAKDSFGQGLATMVLG